MKRSLTFAALLLMLTSASAQDGTKAAPSTPAMTSEQRAVDQAQRQTAAMTEMLGLDPEQSAKVLTINVDHAKALAALQRTDPRDGTTRERINAIQQEQDGKLKEVLTAEQYEKMAAQRSAVRRPVSTPPTQEKATQSK